MSDTPNPETASWKDRKLEAIGGKLQSADGRKSLVGGCFRIIRRVVSWSTLAYVAALLLLCLLMRVVGERNIFFGFSLYLPPLIWYLPAFVMLPFCLLVWAWRTLLFSAAAVLATLMLVFGLKFGGGEAPLAATSTRLIVLTNNRGQNANQSLRPFKNYVKPDIMAFQEAGGTAARYLADPGYAEFKDGRDVAGEFSLVSRYPIVSVEPVTVTALALPRTASDTQEVMESFTVAGRYVIDFNGTHIVVYNVHMPSPRDTLRYYQRGVFIYGLIGVPGTPFAAKRQANQKGWDQRIDILQKLLARAKQEKEPTILVGDFNMPLPGWCHQQVVQSFGDAHITAGSGFGCTFPGETRNPLSLGGAWMRIDHLFFDTAHWQCVQAITERDRPSQHRAAAAAFELKK